MNPTKREQCQIVAVVGQVEQVRRFARLGTLISEVTDDLEQLKSREAHFSSGMPPALKAEFWHLLPDLTSSLTLGPEIALYIRLSLSLVMMVPTVQQPLGLPSFL